MYANVHAAPDTIPLDLKPYFFSDKHVPNLITDYDAVGFNIDHCLVKYNVEEFARLTVETYLEDLITHF